MIERLNLEYLKELKNYSKLAVKKMSSEEIKESLYEMDVIRLRLNHVLLEDETLEQASEDDPYVESILDGLDYVIRGMGKAKAELNVRQREEKSSKYKAKKELDDWAFKYYYGSRKAKASV